MVFNKLAINVMSWDVIPENSNPVRFMRIELLLLVYVCLVSIIIVISFSLLT